MTFEQFLNILRARKWIALAVFATVLLTTLIVSLLLPKQYTAQSAVTIDTRANDPVSGQPIAGFMAAGFLATQIDIFKSQNVALNVVDSLGLVNMPEAQAQFQSETGGKGDARLWFAESMARGLDVEPSRESAVINVNYTASDPAFAATVANAFTRAYIQSVVKMKTDAATQSSDFFQQQLKKLQANLVAAQNKLSTYQQEQGIVAGDERIDVETQRLNELSTQLASAQGMTADAGSRTHGGSGAPDVLNNPIIQQIKMQLATQEAEYTQLTAKNGPNHPHNIEAKARLESTRSELARLMGQYAGGLNSAAGNAKTRQQSLASAVEEQKKRVLEIKSQRAKLEVLLREVDNAQRTYDGALARLSQSMLESQSGQSNVSILQVATPPMNASRPRIFLNLMMSVLVGGFLGIAFSLIVELRDRRFRSVHDAQALLNLPLIADIRTKEKKVRRTLPFLSA